MEYVIIWLISVIVSIIILYLVIKTAIDNSTMGKNIQAIKQILEQGNSRIDNKETQQNILNNDKHIVCPSCGDKIDESSLVCPRCSLIFTER
ncbi:hypothetical protein PASE110613_07160 [Paenibacillus sediminis]|uniref:DNA-directed RNA polymerase subunit RPC12/RpoP n=1 Tax=Paenibacillus sediminis TaxID=664909 RepID=A0ABS4H259_9BACL|nr:hypothetical protein [Paenibacillus sediminis]MBP1936566.1 DNA-directed RNA polymerase subunit RPC12/RpoP [Paenibacillus sediminis]